MFKTFKVRLIKWIIIPLTLLYIIEPNFIYIFYTPIDKINVDIAQYMNQTAKPLPPIPLKSFTSFQWDKVCLYGAYSGLTEDRIKEDIKDENLNLKGYIDSLD